MKNHITLYTCILMLVVVGLISFQQYRIATSLTALRQEVQVARVSTTNLAADVVAARLALDDMKLAMSSSTNDLDRLQYSMQQAEAEALIVTSKATQAIVEINYITEYMKQWVWENFPQGGK